MDIKELESFRLADAVKFHDKLNPALWTEKGDLDPEVYDKLMEIAKDFMAELGISSPKVEDITISGSNAAYSYTPHSDLDLHILVDHSKLSDDEIYKELFNAKKTVYNDTHDIKVHGVPVELYVQDSNQPHHSLGEYSLLKKDWNKIPVKRRANFDQSATKAKYEKLGELIELAVKTRSLKRVEKAIDIVKRYRKAGLEKTGEFGPENLAYKALRKQGLVQRLWDLKNELHSDTLSLEDYDPNGPPPGPEFRPTMPKGTVRVDVSDVYDWYKLGQTISNLGRADKSQFGKGPPSTIMAFGDEDLEHKYIKALQNLGLTTTDIDPVDPHQPKGMKRQKVDPTYNVNEEPEDWRPYQGLRDPKNELGVNLFPGKDIVGQRVYHCTNSLKSIQKSGGLKPRPDETGAREYGRLTTNEHPFIPVIGVWFSVGKPDWPGKYCLSFVIEPTDKVYVAYAKSKGELTPNVVLNSIPIDRLKIEKREDIAESASGYIPSNAQKDDPRFKTGLSVDIKPDSIKKNAKAFSWLTSRAGIPPTAKTNGKF